MTKQTDNVPNALINHDSWSSQQPLYLQICQRLKHCIAQGLYPVGSRIPSARILANELGVSRTTIDTAYALLVAEEVLASRGQAGTFVNTDLKGKSALLAADNQATSTQQATTERPKLPYPLPFQMGLPALDHIPRKLWSRLGARTLREMTSPEYGYPDHQGLAELRAHIATYLQISRGVSCQPQQVFITSGYRHGLTLLTEIVLNREQGVFVEDPCFIYTRDVFEQLSVRLHPVLVDEHGLKTQQLSDKANTVIVTPAHQSPTCVAMTLSRRLALLDWANATADRFIIEDDYDGEFHYANKPLPALKHLDKHDKVIYMGSFSKVLSPAIRLSYIVVPQSLTDLFNSQSKKLFNGCDQFTQKLVATFMQEGHFMRHIHAMRRLYKKRYQYLANALDRLLDKQQAEVIPNPGGMHLILALNKQFDDQQMGLLLRQQHFSVQVMSEWALKHTPNPALMLGFTNIQSEKQAETYVRQIQHILWPD